MKLLLLFAGGGIGTLARYYISGLVHRHFHHFFPFGTLAVNLAGSFIIGFIWGIWDSGNIPSLWRTFVMIGILGGFTTFSSFSLESMNLFRDGEIKAGILNILANNVLGLVLVFTGFTASGYIFHSR